MELRHLRYFVAVGEAQNMSRAALKLHVSQPALSAQIRDLEDEIGFQLLERTAKSVRLTKAGRAFLDEARAVLQRADEAVKKARSIAAAEPSELHVGYSPTPVAEILPKALRAFQHAMPKIYVRLHDRVCVGVAPQHPFARRRAISLTEIAAEPLIGLTHEDYPEYYDYLSITFSKLKQKPRVMEEHDSMAGILSSVEAGTGVAIGSDAFSYSFGNRLKRLRLIPEPN